MSEKEDSSDNLSDKSGESTSKHGKQKTKVSSPIQKETIYSFTNAVHEFSEFCVEIVLTNNSNLVQKIKLVLDVIVNSLIASYNILKEEWILFEQQHRQQQLMITSPKGCSIDEPLTTKWQFRKPNGDFNVEEIVKLFIDASYSMKSRCIVIIRRNKTKSNIAKLYELKRTYENSLPILYAAQSNVNAHFLQHPPQDENVMQDLMGVLNTANNPSNIATSNGTGGA